MKLAGIDLRFLKSDRARLDYPRQVPALMRSVVVLLVMLPVLPSAAATDSSAPPAPRLILQITVDALRGDLPRRYAHVLGEGGFRYLMEQGVDYTNAHSAVRGNPVGGSARRRFG